MQQLLLIQSKPEYVAAGARFSPCRFWRLWRQWDEGTSQVGFIGLNPSTADEVTNDNTVSKCIKYAKLWGYSGMLMLNVFALRSTDPRGLKKVADPIGPENDMYIQVLANTCKIVVAAWGRHANLMGRHQQLLTLLKDAQLMKLRINQDGTPMHPLYLPGDIQPTLWVR